MLDIAARAPGSVKLPSRKVTRQLVITTFKEHMSNLRTTLLSDAVKGSVNLTCDAWQASNTDAYFAVTGSWVQENSPGVWEVKTALIGFTQMNNAHNGVRLGQALYLVVHRLGITHKIGHVTCDNASNMDTMADEFAKHVEKATGKPWNPVKRRVR